MSGPETEVESRLAITISIFSSKLKLQGIRILTAKMYSTPMHEQFLTVGKTSVGIVRFPSSYDVIAPGSMGELMILATGLVVAVVLPSGSMNISFLSKADATRTRLEL